MSISKQKVGEIGEKTAEAFLRRKGYKILDRNYFVKSAFGPKTGEIDIVAEKNNAISFVEVKTLAANPRAVGGGVGFIAPEQKVNFQKQRKLIKTAQSWLMKNKISFDKKWQIDAIAIKIDLNTKKAKIKHFKNAVSS